MTYMNQFRFHNKERESVVSTLAVSPSYCTLATLSPQAICCPPASPPYSALRAAVFLSRITMMSL
ncbi:hypothetical protein J6590_079091 [Homalodisca vitripennis]|nr:hypothetical protein J6590_079091 [Homalodisca vitripennis]